MIELESWITAPALPESKESTIAAVLEVYRDEQAVARHKETAHYKRWREAVDPLLAEPRTRTVYQNIHPGENGWG